MSHLVDYLAHAVAWQAVKRWFYSLPDGWALYAFIGAAALIVLFHSARWFRRSRSVRFRGGRL